MKTAPLTFEQAMNRLDEITEKMSGQNLSLEESLELYTEATRLISFCNKKLTVAKLKVQKLSEENLEDDR